MVGSGPVLVQYYVASNCDDVLLDRVSPEGVVRVSLDSSIDVINFYLVFLVYYSRRSIRTT